MSAYLLAGWDLARVGSMSVYASDGVSGAVANVVTGTYAHRDLSSVMGAGEYESLAAHLNSIIGTVTFDATTLRYTIAYPSLQLDFTEATIGDQSGNRLAAALGFDASHPNATGTGYDCALTGASSYTSNITPYYALALAKGGPSKYSRPYEVSGQTVRQVSSNGRAYSVGPVTREKRLKFELAFQSLAATFADEADASAPWTYEDLVAHVRCWEPVLLSYPGGDLVYKLVRGEFDEESRKSVWKDFHGRWNLAIEGQYLGAL